MPTGSFERFARLFSTRGGGRDRLEVTIETVCRFGKRGVPGERPHDPVLGGKRLYKRTVRLDLLSDPDDATTQVSCRINSCAACLQASEQVNDCSGQKRGLEATGREPVLPAPQRVSELLRHVLQPEHRGF